MLWLFLETTTNEFKEFVLIVYERVQSNDLSNQIIATSKSIFLNFYELQIQDEN